MLDRVSCHRQICCGRKPNFFSFLLQFTNSLIHQFTRLFFIGCLLSTLCSLLSPLHAALSCTSCHGYPPSYASAPNKMNSHPVHQSYGCATCHIEVTTGPYTITFATNHVNGTYNVWGVDYSTYKYTASGSSCTVSCHGDMFWGKPARGCPGCHEVAIKGRRAISGEFKPGGENWSHKRADLPKATVVTSTDCAVCHLEGNQGGGVNSTYHQEALSAKYLLAGTTYFGMIQLRNPDTNAMILFSTWSGRVAGVAGSTWTSGAYMTWATVSITSATTGYRYRVDAGSIAFTRFTRDTSTAPLEAWVTSVQNNLCLKCHDPDFVANASALPVGETASSPFIGTGTIVNVSTHFATVNASYHPVIGPQNNPFCDIDTMLKPWNQFPKRSTPTVVISGDIETGGLISCWDCHLATATAHGNPATLRAAYDAVASQPSKLCIVCHSTTTVYWGATQPGMVGKTAFEKSTAGTSDVHPNASATCHTNTLTGGLGCSVCHGSRLWSATTELPRKTRAEDVHGFNLLWISSGSTWGWGARPYSFFRNTQNYGNWNPARATGYTFTSARPNAGNCQGPGGTNTICGQSRTGHGGASGEGYSPGGSY